MSYIIYSKLPPEELLESISKKIERGYYLIGDSNKNAKKYGGFVSNQGFSISRNNKSRGPITIINGVVEPYEQGSKITISGKLHSPAKAVIILFLSISWLISLILLFQLIKNQTFYPIILVPLFFSIFFTLLAWMINRTMKDQKYYLKDLIDD